jgi:hypothetical protein
MKWVEKNIKNSLTLWIALILINAILSVWLCFIIETISSEVLLSSKDVVVEEFRIYEGTLQLWKSAYVIVILTATGLVIASGMATILIPQPRRFVKKVKLKDRSLIFEEENVTSNDDEVLEKSTVVIKTLKRS